MQKIKKMPAKKLKPYVKLSVEVVQLISRETVLGSCQTTSSDNGPFGIGCNPAAGGVCSEPGRGNFIFPQH